MKMPFFPASRILSAISGSQYVRFIFWTLVLGLVVGIGMTILIRLGTLESMELSLLDLKLRYRADNTSAAPAKDIVLIGLDEKTNQYIRLHPESGLSSITLPRETLADILNYLTDQGARAVVFDLEFKDPKEGDAKLAQAIRRNGHVYVANRLENPLYKLIDHDKLVSFRSQADLKRYQEKLAVKGLLQPYLTYHSALNGYLLPEKTVTPLDIGVGPYFNPLPNTGEFLWVLSDYLNTQRMREDRFQTDTLLVEMPRPEPPVFSDLEEQAFNVECTIENYRLAHKGAPSYLSMLRQDRLNVHQERPIRDNDNKRLTYCYAHPTVGSIMASVAGIGVPSIDYDDDAYIRSAKGLFRSYEGNFYTYLGIRPALDLLGIDTITYTPENLYIGQRRVPLQNGHQILINWKNPKLLLKRMFKDSGIATSPQEQAALITKLNSQYAPYQALSQKLQDTGLDLLDPDVLKQLEALLQPQSGPPPQTTLPQNMDQRLVVQILTQNPEASRRFLKVLAEFQRASRQPSLEQINNELKRIDKGRNNKLLGGGHLYRTISAIDVIRLTRHDKFSREEKNALYAIPFYPETGMFSFKDKIVVIGNTVTDIHRTPMSDTMFGPEVVASVLDMFLNDETFIEKPPASSQWLVVILLALSISAAIVTFENLAVGFTAGIILLTLYWVLSFFLFAYFGLWFDMLLPSAAMGFSLIASTLYRYYIHDREKHLLTNVFSKYVSPQLMEQIVQNPEHAMENLKGGKKELTVLFSDLQGFTHQFEDADPEMMVSQLNEYFDVMTEIILEHQGTYDKYMGDSIMAFFGAPTDVPNHAEMACRAAIDMQRALLQLNKRWTEEGRKTLSHGIGIASGEMFVGNFGSKKIKNFTVMGSNVNLGSRLEAFTRVAQWPVIISARTFELARDQIRVRDLGRIQVKGFSDTVQVYGLENLAESNVTSAPFGEAPAERTDVTAS
jgi:class 3 adenylate cyclase/CHASE2 domain-containing sensor protein